MTLTHTNLNFNPERLPQATMSDVREAILTAVSDNPGRFSPAELMMFLDGARWNGREIPNLFVRQAFWALLGDGEIRVIQPEWRVGIGQPRDWQPR